MQSCPQTKHSHPHQSTRKCIQAQDATTAKTLQTSALNITPHALDNEVQVHTGIELLSIKGFN